MSACALAAARLPLLTLALSSLILALAHTHTRNIILSLLIAVFDRFGVFPVTLPVVV